MEFEKTPNNHGILWNNLTKPLAARKLAVRVLCVWQLVFCLLVVSYLIISKCMHGLSLSMPVLLHSAFMLSVVKLLLKVEVGGCALNSHGNYIVDHGKSWKNHELCFWISVGTLFGVHIIVKPLTGKYLFYREEEWSKEWGELSRFWLYLWEICYSGKRSECSYLWCQY